MGKIAVIYLDLQTGFIPDLHHGLASLAASVSKKGHLFKLYHLTEKESPALVAENVLSFSPDVLGFSFTTNQRKYLDSYSKAIAEKSSVLQIAGGIHPTIDPFDVFSLETIQGVCLGEGEKALPLLLHKISRQETILDTPNFWFRNAKGEIIKNPVLALDEDLSELPYPDYSIFDMAKINRLNSGWMNMLITRGCPYNCSYCCNHALRSIYPNKENYVRLPPIDYAISLIKNNLSLCRDVKGIVFVDDLFIFKREWLNRFLKKYREEINLPFICNGRVELLTQEVCSLLKESGCILVRIGVESGNEWLRKFLLKRPESNSQIISAFSKLKRFGISTFSYNILGLPFETKEQMRDTILINRRISPDQGAVYYFFPYPATHLYNICKEFGLLLDSSREKASYLEGPSIKLTHCDLNICIRLYNELKLYLLTCSARKVLGVFAVLLYLFFRIYPSILIKIFSQRSATKNFFRKLFYDRLYYKNRP